MNRKERIEYFEKIRSDRFNLAKKWGSLSSPETQAELNTFDFVISKLKGDVRK